ncbi:MAG: hypothetical protein IKB81_06665 [Paludibacteraceae bacterium]|nr:hypothetical protein [Paludibacteraceae bacterium]
MKTIKYLLLVFLLGSSTILMATDFTLHQTSFATMTTISSGGGGSGDSYGGSMRHYAGSHACPASMTTPMVNFHSTSTMTSSGSSLPSAATTGFISADDNLSDNSNFTPQGPKRVGPDGGFGDPGAQPLGDAVPCLLILAIGYAIYLGRKTSVPNPDSRK